MSDTTLEAEATRRGTLWVVHVAEHGVYRHGRTLQAARANTVRGLAHAGVDVDVRLTATTPELQTLRAAADAYTTAQHAAVTALASQGVTVRDITAASGMSAMQIRLLLAGQQPTCR